MAGAAPSGLRTSCTVRPSLHSISCGILLSVIAWQCFTAPGRAEEPTDPLAGFDEYAQSALTDLKTPGMAVAILKEGKVLLARGYGLRRAASNDAVDAETLFPIASVTKVFTVTALAQLVDQCRLKWDDRVTDYLPEFELYDPFLTKDVRISDLVSHRLGLETADLVAYRGDYDRAEILRRMRYMQPVAPFRSRYIYNNHAVTAAGEILQRMTGQSWHDCMEQGLLQQLGMKATLTHFDQIRTAKNAATPHQLQAGVAVPDPMWDPDANDGLKRLHEAVAPAGAIWSNVTDMSRFLQMCLNGGQFDGRQIVNGDTLEDMYLQRSSLPIKPNPAFAYARLFYGCGYGWHLRDWRGRKVVYHTGSSGAVAAMMPAENVGVVVLCNRGASGLGPMVMHDVFDRLLGIPRTWSNRDWVNVAETEPQSAAKSKNEELESKRERNTSPSLPLKNYAGAYSCDLYGKLMIEAQDGELKLQFGPNIHATLRHWEHDTFRGKLNFPAPGDWLVRFVVKNGAADRVEIERIFWHEAMPEFRRVTK